MRRWLASEEHDGGFAPEAQLGQRAAILLPDALQERRNRLVACGGLAPEDAHPLALLHCCAANTDIPQPVGAICAVPCW